MRKIVLLIMVLSPIFGWAQDITGGVRLGLNINSITGPLETGDAESFDSNTGFLVGGLLDVGFTDLFGVRGEFLFSQKGGRLLYQGNATQVFNPGANDEVVVSGMRNSVIRINNSYIDIPIMGYIRPIKKLKIFAGLSFGFLVSSQGFGELEFDGTSVVGQVPVAYTNTLDHNYLKDEGAANTELPTLEMDLIKFRADGADITFAKTVGAYELDFQETGDPLYNAFDLGFIGGLAYYLNSSLFVSAMVNTSLGDITNTDKDLAKGEIGPDNQRIFRDDIDRNLSIQLSLGFQF